MDTTTIDTHDEDWDRPGSPAAAGSGPGYGGEDAHLPIRSRRRLLTPLTALLIAVITAAGGFYAGVRVEKNQIPTGGAGGARSAFAGRLRSLLAGVAPGAAAGAAGTVAPSGTAAALGAGAAGLGGGLTGFAARFGGGSAGTVTAVDGSTIYLSEISGNTVKVTVNPATTITKAQPVARTRIHPGDTISVRGLTTAAGTIVATAITDAGAPATGSGAPGAGAAGGGAGAAGGGGLSSLFGSGG
jgi:hypothetical protein